MSTLGGVLMLSAGVVNLATGDWLKLGTPLKELLVVMGFAFLVESFRQRWMRQLVRQDRYWTPSLPLSLYALVEGVGFGACVAYFLGGPLGIAAGVLWLCFSAPPLVGHLVWRAEGRPW